MNSYMLLMIGAIALVVLLIVFAIIVIGKKRGEAKKVSFEKPVEDQPKQLTQEEKSGNYQATGGFKFAPAKPAAEPVKAPRPATDAAAHGTASAGSAAGNRSIAAGAAAATGAAAAASSVQQSSAAQLVNRQLRDEQADKAAADKEKYAAEKAAAQEAAADKAQEMQAQAVEFSEAQAVSEEAADEEAEAAAEKAEAQKEQVADEAAAAQAEADAEAQQAETQRIVDQQAAAAEETAAAAAEAEKIDETALSAQADAQVEEEAAEAAAAADAQAEAAAQALETTPVPAGEPEPVAAPIDDIAPAAGRLGRLRGRLSRSQNAIGKGLMGILSAGDLDDDAWEEIEDTLIMADLGTKTTMAVTDNLREMIAERGVSNEEEARAMLREALIAAGHSEMDRAIHAMPNEGKPAVVLVVGVNGTGKTTTTGKLARVLVSMGHKVLLGAADTFRAAAADQLETWGRRVGAETVRGKEGADPASVAFDAVARGVEQQADVVLIDTAGRLHTSTDLMDQLGKVKRVVEKKTPVDEVLMVIDATVGQNGLTQARVFREVVDITGVVLTKLDGTAKGGIVFQVQEELGVPVKLVGLGEGADDLAPFEIDSFVDALLGSSK